MNVVIRRFGRGLREVFKGALVIGIFLFVVLFPLLFENPGLYWIHAVFIFSMLVWEAGEIK